jgi:hypothetical protein
MMQDWTWWCQGCGKAIEPYESHDMEKCYRDHGVKPYQSPPLVPADRIFITGFFTVLALGAAALIYWGAR